MSRRDDRIHAFKLIFSSEFDADQNRDAAFAYYMANNITDTFGEAGEANADGKKPDKPDREFIKGLYFGTLDKKNEIDQLIARFSEGWHLSRISKVDLCVLRLAIYELMGGLRHKVAVNEALEISAVFSGDKAKPFVNGILGNVIKHLGVDVSGKEALIGDKTGD